MSEWEGKSDPEISKAVAETLGFTVKVSSWSLAAKKESMPYSEFLKGDVYYIDTTNKNIDLPDYCNNPQDAWSIILNNNIVVTPCIGIDAGDATGYSEHSNPVEIEFYDDGKALRAAMIVYLEMNGVKPNE